MTRDVCYSVAMSLDGYIAGPRGEYDWIVIDPDFDFAKMMATFDTIMMGRTSYEMTRQHADSFWPGMEPYVFSRRLRPDDCPDAQLSDSPAEVVAQLKKRPGKDIWLFGGGQLFQSCLQLGLVDRIEIAVVPILLGGGIPMLPAGVDSSTLTLTEHRVYPKTGTVFLKYTVQKA